MKLGCIGVVARCDKLLRGTESPYFSKGGLILRVCAQFQQLVKYLFLLFF